MKKSLWMCLLLLLAVGAIAQTSGDKKPAPKSSGEAINQALSIVEWETVSAAEAMPDEKYSFRPTQGDFKDVRTFGDQYRHMGYVNYMFASFLTGEKNPLGESKDENGPELKTKAEIVKQLKDSYAALHKAISTLNSSNELDQVNMFGMQFTKLGVAAFAVAHPMDHYGQSVEYLRMNNVVPPASRPQPKK